MYAGMLSELKGFHSLCFRSSAGHIVKSAGDAVVLLRVSFPVADEKVQEYELRMNTKYDVQGARCQILDAMAVGSCIRAA